MTDGDWSQAGFEPTQVFCMGSKPQDGRLYQLDGQHLNEVIATNSVTETNTKHAFYGFDFILNNMYFHPTLNVPLSKKNWQQSPQ